MANNMIILFTIVASFTVFEFAQPYAIHNKFCPHKYGGNWFSIGRISACKEKKVHPCSTYKILPTYESDDNFVYAHIPYENITDCDHGVPINTYATIGKIRNLTIHVGGAHNYPLLTSTIKSYNGDGELIITDIKSNECASTSYRLWSRKRHVSSRTKHEFEKLAGNRKVEYYSWENCPTLRSETNDEFTISQFKGPWYDISAIYYGVGRNDICKMQTISPKKGEGSFVQKMTTVRNGNLHKTKLDGRIHKSKLMIELPSVGNEQLPFSVISCNNGNQLILAEDFVANYGLLSRYPKVPAETIKEFGKIARKFPNILHAVHPHHKCSKWSD